LICKSDGTAVEVTQQPVPTIPTELLSLFDRGELKKYMTEEELTALPEEKN
jgi:succinate dehydrogenase / fumarate reductase flavoprotein subunit